MDSPTQTPSLSRLSSTMSLPRLSTSSPSSSCSPSSTSQLIDYTHVPDSARIPATQLPVVNPYKVFHKPSFSPTRSIKKILRSTPAPATSQDVIQSSSMDQCLIPASTQEHYLDLHISPELIKEWLKEGFTHLHFGAVRIVLGAHGRHGLPTAVKMALLNTTFKRYEHAVLGTVLTTLNTGSVVLTFFPNFNVPLKDPNLPDLLKLQIQMTGTEQVASAFSGTLHHQLVYRLQNHAFNLPQASFSGDPLLVIAEQEDVPTIVQIPKQMAREELRKRISLHWFTNYENIHKASQPLVAADPTFQTMPDGTVKTSFAEPDSDDDIGSASDVFPFLMITPASTKNNPEEDIPVHSFYPDGSIAYVDKSMVILSGMLLHPDVTPVVTAT